MEWSICVCKDAPLSLLLAALLVLIGIRERDNNAHWSESSERVIGAAPTSRANTWQGSSSHTLLKAVTLYLRNRSQSHFN